MPTDDHFPFSEETIQFSISKFDNLDSTNLFLKNHLSNYPDFAVIITDNQFEGRGRFDRKWQSSAGNSLTFSVKIPVSDIPQQNWTNITQVMALAVASLLEELGLKPSIRWPNDVLINHKKICGILAEVAFESTKSSVILGVGLNINNHPSDFINLDRAATSLQIETRSAMLIDEVLVKLLKHFSYYHTELITNGFKKLSGMISERLYNTDDTIQIIQGNDTYIGKIQGITERGTVLIKTDTGVEELISGEITSRKDIIR
jgi:BirA family transcriptional regulator, biotin operon repressor / biotin---[acetyl-CoA-carboxylase] ligase